MTENTPSSRFRVVPVPERSPGMCFLCRSSSNAPFVDTGMSHDWYFEAPDPTRDGVVYICAACVTEMAHNLNLVDADISLQVQNAYKAGEAKGLAYGKAAIHEFATQFSSSIDGIIAEPVGDSDLGDDLSEQDTKEDEPGEQRVAEEPGNADRPANGNGRSKRSNGVSSNSADGELHSALDELLTD